MLEVPITKAMVAALGQRKPKTPHLVSGLPYISLVDDVTLMLRDGDIMSSFIVEGINADTSDDRRISELSEGLARIIAQQRADIAVYIHRFSLETKPITLPVKGNAFNEEIDRRWQSYLQAAGLRDRTNMVTVVMRPPKKLSKFVSMFFEDENQSREDLRTRAQRLDQIIKSFMAATDDAKPKRLHASDGQWLGFLRTMIDGSNSKLLPGAKFQPVADLLCAAPVNFAGTTFTTEDPATGNKRYGAILSIKDYPNETYPGIFDRFNMPYDMVITQSFCPISSIRAQEKISLVRKQMKAAEDAAVSLMLQLEEAEDDTASGRVIFGDHHCSVSVFCDSEEELTQAVTYVSRAMQEAGATAVREGFAARSVYFAQHPGNFAFRTRPAMISSKNFAEFSALHGQSKGNPPEKCPWGESVTTIPTGRGEVFRLNFHLAGKPGQRTVGHTLILGQTGSGKTLGTAFLLSQAQRLNPRVIIFDKDNGFEMAVRAMGGSYSPVRLSEPTGFNPMRAESDTRGVTWLTDWLTTLASVEGRPLTPMQLQALTDAAQANSNADVRLQNFSQFRSQLRATDDDGDLYERLGRWDTEGQFGWLFGGKGVDQLAFNSHITAFDLTEIFDNDIIRTAWLSYVFRRIERLVEDEYPTLLVLDEAWRLLDDPYFQLRLKDWMLTMRKKNVAVVLLTQRVSHIANCASGDAILESAVTRLVYPSSYNTEAELAPLNLTPSESAFLQTSNVGNHFVLFKSGQDSVVLDLALGSLGKGLDILGGGRGEKAPKGWRDNPDFAMELMK